MAETRHPIQSALEREGMSIRELARRMARPGENEENVRRAIGKWLAGEANPSVPSAKRIANVLGGQAGDYRVQRPRVGDKVAVELAALRAEVAALRAALEAAPAHGHAGGGSEPSTSREGRPSELAAAVRALQGAAVRIVEIVEAGDDPRPVASARAGRRARSG